MEILFRQKYVDFYRSIALNLSKLRSNEVEFLDSSSSQSFVSSSLRPVIQPMLKKPNASSMKSVVHHRLVSPNISSHYFSFVLVEDNSREIIQSACRSIGSIKDNEFDVRFNPDLFQPHVLLSQTVRTE